MTHTCDRGACQEPAIRKQGHQWLCVKHYRYGQMRAAATRRGLAPATDDQFDAMLRPDFCCPECSRPMNWLREGGADTVATFQHYRDGTLSIVCHSCNVRHSGMPGDSYRDMPKDHKRCPKCEQVKPLSEFAHVASKPGPFKAASHCKQCNRAAWRRWRDAKQVSTTTTESPT